MPLKWGLSWLICDTSSRGWWALFVYFNSGVILVLVESNNEHEAQKRCAVKVNTASSPTQHCGPVLI